MGQTFDIFQLSGKIPDNKQFWKIIWIEVKIETSQILSMRAETLSCLVDLFGLRDVDVDDFLMANKYSW